MFSLYFFWSFILPVRSESTDYFEAIEEILARKGLKLDF